MVLLLKYSITVEKMILTKFYKINPFIALINHILKNLYL